MDAAEHLEQAREIARTKGMTVRKCKAGYRVRDARGWILGDELDERETLDTVTRFTGTMVWGSLGPDDPIFHRGPILLVKAHEKTDDRAP